MSYSVSYSKTGSFDLFVDNVTNVFQANATYHAMADEALCVIVVLNFNPCKNTRLDGRMSIVLP